MAFAPPDQGLIFWPVNSGDSTTIRVVDDIFLQIDLNHMAKAEDDGETAWPVIDELEKILPKKDGKPYLSAFVLTHPDQDHCRGFEELLDRVTIGELWLSPRTFDESNDAGNFSDDAKAFQSEADRRVKKTIADGGASSGDKVRIIGYADRLDQAHYKGLPDAYISVPGTEVTEIDGFSLNDVFSVFIHAPFRDDQYGDRNDCSIALQLTLNPGETAGKALFFGDLSYPVLARIFDVSDDEDLEWQVLQAPHHCSKSAMYWADDPDDDETLKQDILDNIDKYAMDSGYIVSSSASVPKSNKPGDNPPHVIAKTQYERVAPTGFLCTHDHPEVDSDSPEPIVFDLTENGFEYRGQSGKKGKGGPGLGGDVDSARGRSEPSQNKVGFGK